MDSRLLVRILGPIACYMAASVSLWVAAFAFYGLRRERGRPLALLATAIFLWNVGEAAKRLLPRFASGDAGNQVLAGTDILLVAGNLSNLAFASIPALLYLFARGDGFRGLRSWRGPLLLAPALASNALLWLSDFLPSRTSLFSAVAYSIQFTAGVVILGRALWILTLHAKNRNDSEHAAAARMLAAICLFLTFFGLFRLGAFGRPPLDPSPLLMAVALVFVATAYNRLDPFASIAESEKRLKRFEFMVDASREDMSIINRELRYEAVNAAFCDTVGRSREEIIGMKVADVLGEAVLRGRMGSSLEECFLGCALVYRTRYAAEGGEDGFKELSFYPYTPRGAPEPTHAVMVSKDITDYVRKELDLEKARRAADEANRAKGDFLASMSHEIRTPINAVKGLTELALRRDLEDDLRDDLETVRAASANLLAIVNDILDLSKIESGRLRLERTIFSPAAAVDRIIKAFRPAIEQKAISLDLEVDRRLAPRVLGDPLRFGQILFNLIGNAVKFTDKGGVVVSVYPASNRTDGQRPGVQIEVRDTGIGIQGDKLETIFESFTQADAGTSRRFGGTGLGLTISRRLAVMLGGDIVVESTPGVGSSFIVTVYFEHCDNDSAPSSDLAEVLTDAARDDLSASLSFHSHPERPASKDTDILLVEDNEVNARVARRFLEMVNRGCVRTRNGREALRLLGERSFSLVLMDVEMPDMDGLETTRRIRAGEAGEEAKGVTIIAMTAHSEKEARSSCAEAGMDHFVSKPLNFEELESLIVGVASGRLSKRDGRESTLDPVAAAPLLNWEKTLSRLGGDESLLRDLYGVLQDEASVRCESIRRHAEEGDHEALRKVAHMVKGSASSIGAERLSVAASLLEKAAAVKDFRMIEETLEPFLAVYADTAEAARITSG